MKTLIILASLFSLQAQANWELIRKPIQLADSILSSGLRCDENADVYFSTFHGEGSGCGESGKTIIAKQTYDWSKKEIYVITEWQAGRTSQRGACHYFGPIYGGGKIKTMNGIWKVIVDGNFVGEYTHQKKYQNEGPHKSSKTIHCEITL